MFSLPKDDIICGNGDCSMDKEKLLIKYMSLTESACYMLLSIAQEPRHGYGIMQHTKLVTDNKVTLGNELLYGMLAKMNTDGLIEIKYQNEKKIYVLTPLGTDVLIQEKERLKKLLLNLEQSLLTEEGTALENNADIN